MKKTLLFTIATLTLISTATFAMHDGDKMDHKPMHGECVIATGTNASGTTVTGCIKPMHADHTGKHHEMKEAMHTCMMTTGATMTGCAMNACMATTGATATGCAMKMDMMKPLHDAREDMKDAKHTMKEAKEEIKAAKIEIKAAKKAIKPMRKMMKKAAKKPVCATPSTGSVSTGAMTCTVK